HPRVEQGGEAHEGERIAPSSPPSGRSTGGEEPRRAQPLPSGDGTGRAGPKPSLRAPARPARPAWRGGPARPPVAGRSSGRDALLAGSGIARRRRSGPIVPVVQALGRDPCRVEEPQGPHEP